MRLNNQERHRLKRLKARMHNLLRDKEIYIRTKQGLCLEQGEATGSIKKEEE